MPSLRLKPRPCRVRMKLSEGYRNWLMPSLVSAGRSVLSLLRRGMCTASARVLALKRSLNWLVLVGKAESGPVHANSPPYGLQLEKSRGPW